LREKLEGLSKTKIIAGGPVFTADRGFARRTGIHFAAKNVAYFIRFMVQSEGGAYNGSM
jgi:hypothetical protein